MRYFSLKYTKYFCEKMPFCELKSSRNYFSRIYVELPYPFKYRYSFMQKKTEIIEENALETLPMLPLRGLTVFPGMGMGFDVERASSVAAVEKASGGSRRIFLVSQRDALKDRPIAADLYHVGVICEVRQFIRGGDSNMRVIVEGVARARILNVSHGAKYASATVARVPDMPTEAKDAEVKALIGSAIDMFGEFLAATERETPEVMISLALRGEPGYIADYIAQNLNVDYRVKQELLEMLDPAARLTRVLTLLSEQLDVIKIRDELNKKLNDRLGNMHREQYLREEINVLRAELGDDDSSDIDEYREKIALLSLPQEIEEKLFKETDRLAKQPFGSSEASVIRGWLDAVLALPWHSSTEERLDIAAAKKILDKEHYGLTKVKERILEFLSVRKVAPDVKGAILCLVGPPGVGKTSIAMSVAHATNRKLARMSLGGVHDEAEIRGHRKTYVGAMPGRIMTAVTQSGSNNPILLLDEIDKLGSDYRGDPSAALLEALDPVENTTFRDHFLEVPFDLSNVMFIMTANTLDTIPRPLLDRMEVIELGSYTDEEKVMIAKNHLIPKMRKKHGLDGRSFRVSDAAVRALIAQYTRESGVRQLEREIAALCRKCDERIATGEGAGLSVKPENLEALLGAAKFKPEANAKSDRVGVVNGLAWTQVGGEILEVEAVALEGTGKIELTGNLGKVMTESAQAAVSCIRARAKALGIDPEFYKSKDIHIHFPEGAVPKDGPSAGITIAIAVISALTGAPVRRDIAMTGEITLTGRVLAIGGLREKTMAALRRGVKLVVVPKENEPDISEIDENVREKLSFSFADSIDDVIPLALRIAKKVQKPALLPEKPAKKAENSKLLRQ